MDSFGGGSWSMIPNIPGHSNPTTPSSQDNLYLQPQQQQQQQFLHQQSPQQQFLQQQQFIQNQQQFIQQQSPQQFHQQSPQQFHLQSPQQLPPPQQQQQILQQQQQQMRFQSPPQQQQQQTPPAQPPQQQHHQSLASHFHLLHLVENLSDAIENGTRDQQSDALVAELNTQFEKCQQLLNSISGSINAKSMTVDGQKKKLEESELLVNQRKDLISKYRNSVEELINSDP